MQNDGQVSSESRSVDFGLLPLEQQIIGLTVDGYSTKETAERVGIDESALGEQLASIYRKVHVSNQFELILFAVHYRLIDVNDRIVPSSRKSPRLKNKVWSKSPL